MPGEYEDFIIADNDSEVANTDSNKEVETLETNTEETNLDEVEIKEGVTAEPTEEVEKVEKAKEYTETQRVSQRINEARQQAKDEVIANMGYEWNGKQITTEAQYNQAIAEQSEQNRIAELESNGIDTSMLNDAVENNPTVKQAKELLAQQAKQQAQQRDYNEFLAEFPDVKPEEINKETWELVNQGKSLVDAYARQQAKEMKEKLKVYTQNKTNKDKAPINKGISTHGSDESASEDEFMRGFDSVL